MLTQSTVGRRRVLQILASGAGLAMLSGKRRSALRPHLWRGTALGATASIMLYHSDAGLAQQVLLNAEMEIRRLEQEFSLYRPNSALCQLNRQGCLDYPSVDLVRLLSEAREISELTDGAFDVSVQPLWAFHRSYVRYLAAPDPDALTEILPAIDYRAITISPQRVSLAKPEMALTLNGIAQGYITDRIAERLRASGFDNVLLNLGEVRVLGNHPNERPWQIGIAHPRDRTRIVDRVDLVDHAVATSSAAGMLFDAAGRHHHLFDPRTGRCHHHYASVSVIAPTATLADALSTAFFQLPSGEIARIQTQLSPLRVLLYTEAGEIKRLSATPQYSLASS